MMINFDRLNKWLTLGANIGVVLGLFLLIVEVRQNSKLARVALEAAEIEQTQAMEKWIGDPDVAPVWRKSVLAPQSLTDAEMRIVDAVLASQVQQWWLLIQMKNEGLVSAARVERGIKNDAPFYFGNRFAQIWWAEETVQGWEGTGLMEIADPIVRTVDPTFNANRFESIREQLREGDSN